MKKDLFLLGVLKQKFCSSEVYSNLCAILEVFRAIVD